MSLRFHSDQHADRRHDARLVVERARDHQGPADVAAAVVQTLPVPRGDLATKKRDL